jgi:hypothetical protein
MFLLQCDFIHMFIGLLEQFHNFGVLEQKLFLLHNRHCTMCYVFCWQYRQYNITEYKLHICSVSDMWRGCFLFVRCDTMHIAIAVLRKQPVNPTNPMKPLYWTRIIVPTSGQPSSVANRWVVFVMPMLYFLAGNVEASHRKLFLKWKRLLKE